MNTLNIDLTNKEEVTEFLKNHQRKEVAEYAKEFKGDRKLRKLQVGNRKDYNQGKHKIVEAERLVVNFQKKIVNTASSFLFGEAPSITPTNPKDKAGSEILRTLKANRINSKLLDFSEAVMSSTMGVFIFYLENEEIKTRCFNSDNGIYTPYFDPYGDLKAFFWEFKIDDINYLWVFDEESLYKYEGDGEYNFVDSDSHGFDVIPVVFLEQPEPEWWDVKEMIDRVEIIISKLAGSNNYFAFPILKLKGGTVKNEAGEDEALIEVEEDGKSLLLGYAEKNGHIVQADAEFLQRDTGVDSIKLEIEYLKEFIFNISQTPDLSFDNVKGIGSVSGRALLLMLQDAINKAKRNQGKYRVVIERIINVVKSGMKSTQPAIKTKEVDFDIQFNLSLPSDLAEEIRTIMEATGGKPVLSQESGVKLSPFTNDIQKELEALQKEKAKAYEDTLTLGEDE